METKTTSFLHFSIVFSPLFIFPSSQLFIKQFQSPVTANKSIFIEPLQSINFYQLFFSQIFIYIYSSIEVIDFPQNRLLFSFGFLKLSIKIVEIAQSAKMHSPFVQ